MRRRAGLARHVTVPRRVVQPGVIKLLVEASWIGRLLTWGLIEQSGRTKATRYFVPPALLREAGSTRSRR